MVNLHLWYLELETILVSRGRRESFCFLNYVTPSFWKPCCNALVFQTPLWSAYQTHCTSSFKVAVGCIAGALLTAVFKVIEMFPLALFSFTQHSENIQASGLKFYRPGLHPKRNIFLKIWNENWFCTFCPFVTKKLEGQNDWSKHLIRKKEVLCNNTLDLAGMRV